MVFPLTRVLSEFASALTFEDVPDAAIAAARLGFTDTIACNIAGFPKPGPSLLRKSLQTVGIVAESRLCPGDVFASSADAAMANTTAVAAMIVDRTAGFKHLEPAFFAQPAVQDFMRRVTVQADESIGPDLEPNLGYAARLRVETKDGRTLESNDSPVSLGNWRNPMTAEQHWNRFCACAEGNLAEAKARWLFDCLQELETLTSVRELDGR